MATSVDKKATEIGQGAALTYEIVDEDIAAPTDNCTIESCLVCQSMKAAGSGVRHHIALDDPVIHCEPEPLSEFVGQLLRDSVHALRLERMRGHQDGRTQAKQRSSEARVPTAKSDTVA